MLIFKPSIFHEIQKHEHRLPNPLEVHSLGAGKVEKPDKKLKGKTWLIVRIVSIEIYCKFSDMLP